jgi:hypothetical protein
VEPVDVVEDDGQRDDQDEGERQGFHSAARAPLVGHAGRRAAIDPDAW